MPHAIHVEHLSKTYRQLWGGGAVDAVKELSLTVDEGEIFGLLGPNGAGKTTFVKMLLSVVRPSRGRARLFGNDVADPKARKAIGFLPENHRFPDFLTARQMLDYYGRLAGVPSGERDTRIPALLERVNMSRWADTRIKKYSKGMMQRVGLAQALLNAPRLIFLDEPTDGVDPIGRREIRDHLLQLREEGVTVFLNSHLLSEIERVCDRVAILNHGEMVRLGSVSELTATTPQYMLTCTAVPPELQANNPEMLASVDPNPLPEPLHQYTIAVPDRTTLNAFLDTLRSADVEIEAVAPVRQTLEDYFIDVIQR